MSTAAPLDPDKVPGKLCAEDRALVAEGFNTLRGTDAAPTASGLRITDTLESRFRFEVSHPRNLNAVQLRALTLKLGSLRRLVLDLPRNTVRVECWRTGRVPAEAVSRKRKRGLEPLTTLPADWTALLRQAVTVPTDYKALRGVLLYVLNRDEEFCIGGVAVAHNAATNTYTVSLQGFDAVTSAFIAELQDAWQSLVQDVVVDWSAQTLVVCVRI